MVVAISQATVGRPALVTGGMGAAVAPSGSSAEPDLDPCARLAERWAEQLKHGAEPWTLTERKEVFAEVERHAVVLAAATAIGPVTASERMPIAARRGDHQGAAPAVAVSRRSRSVSHRHSTPLFDPTGHGDGGTRTTSPLWARPPVVSCSICSGTSPVGVTAAH